jgi:5-methyltetrahydropteroyltriglutamate--homocysteine methyltransferase
VQVDEPALREGLPLKRDQWDSYLQWAVDAFRLATAVAQPATQLVTHLCYSEFADILPAIDRLDGAMMLSLTHGKLVFLGILITEPLFNRTGQC